jgi:hypothetical protein
VILARFAAVVICRQLSRMKHGIPLRTLQQRRREDALKLKVLRLQIKVGVEALDRGELAEIADVDLEHYLEKLATPRAS